MDPEVQKKIAAMAEALGVKAEALFGVLVREAQARGAFIGIACLLLSVVLSVVTIKSAKIAGDQGDYSDRKFFYAMLAIFSVVAAGACAGIGVSSASDYFAPHAAAIRAVLGR